LAPKPTSNWPRACAHDLRHEIAQDLLMGWGMNGASGHDAAVSISWPYRLTAHDKAGRRRASQGRPFARGGAVIRNWARLAGTAGGTGRKSIGTLFTNW